MLQVQSIWLPGCPHMGWGVCSAEKVCNCDSPFQLDPHNSTQPSFYLTSFPAWSLNIRSCWILFPWRWHCLPMSYLLHHNFSFLQVKFGLSLSNLATPLFSSVSSSYVTYWGLSFASIILPRCSGQGYEWRLQGLLTGLSTASNLAESTPFLLTILSWDSFIIQFWTSPKFYPSTFSMLSLKSLTCMAGIKLILNHTCQTYTIAQTLDFQAHPLNNVANNLSRQTLWAFSLKGSFYLHILHELIITYLTHQILSILYYVSLLYSQRIPSSDSLPVCW